MESAHDASRSTARAGLAGAAGGAAGGGEPATPGCGAALDGAGVEVGAGDDGGVAGASGINQKALCSLGRMSETFTQSFGQTANLKLVSS